MDGSFLSEYLLSLGYEVYGMIRRKSVAENQDSRIRSLDVEISYGDLLDNHSINRLLGTIKPDEIYNLAAMSHVRVSFDVPQFTLKTNSEGVLNMLDAFKTHCPEARFYQASSSEMFGNSIEPGGEQNEDTPMHPVSPYGCSKLYSYHMVRHYRKAYGLFAANGILFNHESIRRGKNFVIPKIVHGALEVWSNRSEFLSLGNLETSRDFGHSKDYVRAMHAILNHSEADDFVIATGESHTVRSICEYVFSSLGLNYLDHVKQDPKFMRPEELQYLRGDSTKARAALGWKPDYTFTQILDEMIECWKPQYSVNT